ncbi:MAG: hypothetical protein R2708_11700 [Vicinamibacterales bacterium]
MASSVFTKTPGLGAATRSIDGVSRPLRPIEGDVVVGPLRDRPGRFGLRQLPHEYEIAATTLSECVSTGRRFATANRVDIWSIDTHGNATLIERNRLGTRPLPDGGAGRARPVRG